jgi:hypothetical protein
VRKIFHGAAALISLLFVSSPVLAGEVDGLRCGSALIEAGDSEMKVLQECGKPTLVDGGQWMYDMGPMEPKRVIWIQNGYVRAMEEVSE